MTCSKRDRTSWRVPPSTSKGGGVYRIPGTRLNRNGLLFNTRLVVRRFRFDRRRLEKRKNVCPDKTTAYDRNLRIFFWIKFLRRFCGTRCAPVTDFPLGFTPKIRLEWRTWIGETDSGNDNRTVGYGNHGKSTRGRGRASVPSSKTDLAVRRHEKLAFRPINSWRHALTETSVSAHTSHSHDPLATESTSICGFEILLFARVSVRFGPQRMAIEKTISVPRYGRPFWPWKAGKSVVNRVW